MAVLDDNRNTRPLVWPSVLTLVLFDSFWPRGRCAGRPTTNVTCRNTAPETQASVRPTCTKRMAARAAAGPPTVSVTWASVPLSTTSASRSGDTVSVDLASLGGGARATIFTTIENAPPAQCRSSKVPANDTQGLLRRFVCFPWIPNVRCRRHVHVVFETHGRTRRPVVVIRAIQVFIDPSDPVVVSSSSSFKSKPFSRLPEIRRVSKATLLACSLFRRRDGPCVKRPVFVVHTKLHTLLVFSSNARTSNARKKSLEQK